MKNSPRLLSEVPYGALLVYSPRGTAGVSRKSREVWYGIKNDRPGLIARAIKVLGDQFEGNFGEFFGADRIVVPVPRSTPTKEGALWPAFRICEEIVKAGLAQAVRPCVVRTEAVQKSATAGRGERLDPENHADTLECRGDLLAHRFTLVDDVVTKGSTIVAAAAVLRAAFPNSTVRAFALVRTMGLVPEIDAIVDPCTGFVRYEHGHLSRHP